MINIISRALVTAHTRGPQKVVMNTIKGFDELDIPYVVNHALDAADLLWIHDDPQALIAASTLPNNIKVLAGPNIYTLPSELPETLPPHIHWLHPAKWVQDLWDASIEKSIPSSIWPAGIDTDIFTPTSVSKDTVIVYNKMRSDADVQLVTKQLRQRNQAYQVITYGTYSQAQYQSALAHSKAMVWVGRSESQGIALLEALSMNVPVLVWDISHFGQWEGRGKSMFSQEQLAWPTATTAPYFDSRCGERFFTAAEVSENLDRFMQNLEHYQPRTYVTETLCLKQQSQALLNIYARAFGVTETECYSTSLNNTKLWRNATKRYQLFLNLKGALRRWMR